MTYDPTKLIFTDCETTGLDPRRHDAWEIAIISWNADSQIWEETTWNLWPPALQEADTVALSINHFYERSAAIKIGRGWDSPNYAAEELVQITAGKHLVGACPWFDARFYEKLLYAYGYTPGWHYHLIDVEALTIGYLAGQAEFLGDDPIILPLPWKSDWLAQSLNVQRPTEKERHTAIGDAREVKQTFERIMGTWDGSPTTP